MKVYVDSDFCCYMNYAEGRKEYDIPFFENKCKTFIEGYRYIPNGEIWTRKDGEEFHGEMISAWKNYTLLQMAQEAYDEANNIVQIITGEVSADDEE